MGHLRYRGAALADGGRASHEGSEVAAWRGYVIGAEDAMGQLREWMEAAVERAGYGPQTTEIFYPRRPCT